MNITYNKVRTFIGTIIVNMVRIVKWMRCLFMYLFMRNKVILVRAAVKTKSRGVKHFNWGDDINFYYLSLLTGKKIIFLPHGKISDIFPIPSYLGIGSIVSFYNLDKVTIIGSGLINNSEIEKLRGTPLKICFVRGPLTAHALNNYGIECPKIYGDLALTLPLYYKPRIAKCHRIGIVLHILDEKLDIVQSIQQTYPDIKIIHMDSYINWTDIIDDINSCEVVLSSALHGLIVCEAYKIRCKWISFNTRDSIHWKSGYEFKYMDFFASIGKDEREPYYIDRETDIYALVGLVKAEWTPCFFNARALIDALPKNFIK